MKKLITETYCHDYEIDGRLDKVVKELNTILQSYPDAYFEPYRFYDEYSLKLKYTRLENDEEYNLRLIEEEKEKDKKSKGKTSKD